MKAFIFTYHLDYEISYLAYDTLLKAGVDEVVLAYDKSHFKPDKKYNSIATTFPRMGNLNGPKFMEGALDLYLEEAKGHEQILKVDSDTLVFDLEWTKYPETLIGWKYEPHRPFYGLAYALRTEAIPLIKDILYGSNYPISFAEDIMINDLCKDLGVRSLDFDITKGYCGWNWVTRHTVEDHNRFSVINVYRPEGFSEENGRKLVKSKMEQLIAAR